MEIVHLDERRFRTWRARLGPDAQRHVERRLKLLGEHEVGLGMPNVRRLFGGAWELRIHSGLRMYFGVVEGTIVLVEYGTKDTQQRDIQRAMRRLTEMHDAP